MDKGLFFRIFRLTTVRSEAVRTVDCFISILKSHFHNDEIVDFVIQRKEDAANDIDRKINHGTEETKDWLPMPFHPAYFPFFGKRLRVANGISARVLWSLGHADMATPPSFPCTNFAWKSDAPTILNWINRAH